MKKKTDWGAQQVQNHTKVPQQTSNMTLRQLQKDSRTHLSATTARQLHLSLVKSATQLAIVEWQNRSVVVHHAALLSRIYFYACLFHSTELGQLKNDTWCEGRKNKHKAMWTATTRRQGAVKSGRTATDLSSNALSKDSGKALKKKPHSVQWKPHVCRCAEIPNIGHSALLQDSFAAQNDPENWPLLSVACLLIATYLLSRKCDNITEHNPVDALIARWCGQRAWVCPVCFGVWERIKKNQSQTNTWNTYDIEPKLSLHPNGSKPERGSRRTASPKVLLLPAETHSICVLLPCQIFSPLCRLYEGHLDKDASVMHAGESSLSNTLAHCCSLANSSSALCCCHHRVWNLYIHMRKNWALKYFVAFDSCSPGFSRFINKKKKMKITCMRQEIKGEIFLIYNSLPLGRRDDRQMASSTSTAWLWAPANRRENKPEQFAFRK